MSWIYSDKDVQKNELLTRGWVTFKNFHQNFQLSHKSNSPHCFRVPHVLSPISLHYKPHENDEVQILFILRIFSVLFPCFLRIFSAFVMQRSAKMWRSEVRVAVRIWKPLFINLAIVSEWVIKFNGLSRTADNRIQWFKLRVDNSHSTWVFSVIVISLIMVIKMTTLMVVNFTVLKALFLQKLSTTTSHWILVITN